MKLVIFIYIILTSNLIYACDNSLTTASSSVQFETQESSQNEENECCNELCLCNCCNQLSVISLIAIQNICENYSTPIFYSSVQILSDYSSYHWQPPKV